MSTLANKSVCKEEKTVYFYDSPIGFLEIQLQDGCLFSLSKVRSVKHLSGQAGKNPWLIVVPCHRVLAKRGLGEFALGLAVKKYLLNTENITV